MGSHLQARFFFESKGRSDAPARCAFRVGASWGTVLEGELSSTGFLDLHGPKVTNAHKVIRGEAVGGRSEDDSAILVGLDSEAELGGSPACAGSPQSRTDHVRCSPLAGLAAACDAVVPIKAFALAGLPIA